MGQDINSTQKLNVNDYIEDTKEIKALNTNNLLLGKGIDGKNTTVLIDQRNEFKHLCELMGVEEITVNAYLDGNVPHKGVFRLDISECTNEIAREILKKAF